MRARDEQLIDGRWRASADEGPQLVLPDGCVDVIAREGGLWVVGPMTTARWVTIASDPPAGVRFRPGLVRAWLGTSPEELVDAVVDARALPALRDARTLGDVLTLARRADGPPGGVQRLVGALWRAPSARLGALAAELGQSERHLRRQFTVEVGLSPKRFARVRRLQALVQRLSRPRPGALVELALEVGYADQAHMAREVQALCGLSPTALARVVAESFKTPGEPRA